jgi:hypothetical protein
VSVIRRAVPAARPAGGRFGGDCRAGRQAPGLFEKALVIPGAGHRTVGGHLHRIFPRLGITSRAALHAALASMPAATDRERIQRAAHLDGGRGDGGRPGILCYWDYQEIPSSRPRGFQ